MSGIDVFIGLVFSYNIIMGLTQGLLKSLLAVASLVLATIFSPIFKVILGHFIATYLGFDQEFIGIMGLGISWTILYTILNIISGIIIKGMNKTPLKFFDRLAGLGVGLLMSFIIVLVPLLILDAIPILKEIPKVKISLERSALVKLFKPIQKPFTTTFKSILSSQKDEIMKKIKESNKKELIKILGQSKEKEIKELMKSYDIKLSDDKIKNKK
ncbi:MAG: CvpA family protein [Cyanobacteriota bacterium]